MLKNACTFISSPLRRFSFGADTSSYKCIALKLQLAQYISDIYKDGVRVFYCVCEQGVDLWAAEIIIRIMKDDPMTKLYCVIPYEEQAAKWDSDTRELYYTVLAESTEVVFLNKRYKKGCIAEAYSVVLECADKVFAALVGKTENEILKWPCMKGKEVFCCLGRLPVGADKS